MPESITLVGLRLQALTQVPVQDIFAQGPSEARRTALQGEKRLQVLTSHQVIKSPYLRGVVTALAEPAPRQAAVGGPVARAPLSNALAPYPVAHLRAAWLRLKEQLGAGGERLGKQGARLARIAASLLKRSLAAYTWAGYRQASGAAKLPAVLAWRGRMPAPLVRTPGTGPEAQPAVQLTWAAGWPSGQERGYGSWKRLPRLRESRAPGAVRRQRGVEWTVLERQPVPWGCHQGNLRRLRDWTVRRAGGPAVALRLVRDRLPAGRLVRVLTDRFDLSAASVAQRQKERGKIETWWRWLKALLKSNRPLGPTAHALQLQLSAAFVSDLLWRVFKAFGHFPTSLCEFVTRYQERS